MLRRACKHPFVFITVLTLLSNNFAAKAQGVNIPLTTLSETRVYVSESCPSSQTDTAFPPFVITLATALLPKVIDFGVSYANRALQNKADKEKAKNRAVQARGLGWIDGFYRLELVHGKPAIVSGIATQCMVVVRGSFSGDKARSKPCSDYPQRLSAACDWLKTRGVDEVGIYFESQFVLSNDGASFRLQPERLIYVKPLSGKPGTEAGFYDLIFAINFEAPAAAASAITTFGLSVLSFEQIRPIGEFDPAVLAGKSSGWTPGMPVTAFRDEITRIEKLYSDKKAAEDRLGELKAKSGANPKEISDLETVAKNLGEQASTWSKQGHSLGPTNVVVTITEQPHPPENKFLLTAAEVFANSGSDISRAISDNLNQVVTAATAEERTTKIAQQGTLIIAALNAAQVVDEKQAALDRLPQTATVIERAIAARELEIAKIQANIAYLSAGQTPPYPDLPR